MQVVVVIPFFKNEIQLGRCKRALNEQNYKYTVKIHDNSDENIGFTKAVNRLIRENIWEKETEYFIVLNQDCYLKPDAIEKMVKFMDEHPKCAIGGIKQLGFIDEDWIICGGVTQAFPTGMHLVGKVSNGDHAENKKMPWANGACMIVRKEAILDFGLMDENYVLICSDSDWGYTARDRGWETWYIADAACTHELGVSADMRDEKVNTQKLIDIRRFGDKWITDGVFRELSMEIFD